MPCCFKNINDTGKAIEDHTLANNSSFSVYKTEHRFNAKGIYEFVSFASYIFYKISIFFSLLTVTSLGFFRYILSEERAGSVLLSISQWHLRNTDLVRTWNS